MNKEKLEPILGSDGKVIEVLESNIATDKCLVDICDEKLVGIIRMCGLVILHHTTSTDELYVDGVAVVHKNPIQIISFYGKKDCLPRLIQPWRKR